MDKVYSTLISYILTIGWGIVGAVTMSLSLGILIRIFDWLTPVDEWKEIEKGNVSVAIILAAVIIAFGLVIASAVFGG
ncbi:MAG TPA: DUF350 domain-containing protein [Candidatus Eremiobacteraeota bacterium]|nr:MAG: hypothetical protein BWY64_00129 [bacterium ADurb.Bin363]HPZ06570.1 DUF350 domain-containing protein [Candidatus Eremiobacteraeota bacterium]